LTAPDGVPIDVPVYLYSVPLLFSQWRSVPSTQNDPLTGI
jgi:hypothetical protein